MTLLDLMMVCVHEFIPALFHIPDVLNISGIIAAVVVVAFVISVCGLSVCYAQRKGYFSSKLNSSLRYVISCEQRDFFLRYTVSPMKFYPLWRVVLLPLCYR